MNFVCIRGSALKKLLAVKVFTVTAFLRITFMIRPKQIKAELQNEKALLECAQQFGLVGDPTRMKICWLLCKHHELSVGEISELLDVEISTVSHSLKRLRENKFVITRREHKLVYYSLSDTKFNNNLKQFILKL